MVTLDFSKIIEKKHLEQLIAFEKKFLQDTFNKSLEYKKKQLDKYWGKDKKVRCDIVKCFKLINRSRCTFCTQIINDFDKTMQVEHIEVKSKNPDKAFDWKNMLCSCQRCNTVRGVKKYEPQLYINPRLENNIERYFCFCIDGNIYANKSLSSLEVKKANYMIKLYGLNELERIHDRRQFIKDIFKKEYFISFKKNNKYVRFMNAWKYYERRITIWD